MPEAPRVVFVSSLLDPICEGRFAPFVQGQVDCLRELGVDVRVRPVRSRSVVDLFRMAKEIRKTVKSSQADLIHVHYGSLAGAWSVISSFGIPTVVTFHGSDLLGKNRASWRRPTEAVHLLSGVAFSQVAASLASVIVAVSEGVKEGLVRRRDRERAFVLPCGVDLDVFKPGDKKSARQILGLDLDRLFVLFVDPQRKGKRADLAKKAVECFSRHRPDVEMLMMSGVEHQLVIQYLQAADVLLLTSRSEGSPVITKEAIACGLPVVTVDVGDMKHQIADVAGCSVVSTNPEEISLGLAEAARHGRIQLEESKRRALDRREACKILVDIYEMMLGVGRAFNEGEKSSQ